MYSYARYLDLESARVCKDDLCGVISLYVITNTKFTDAAIKYAACTGIKLLSWDYPKGQSLHEKIERLGVYPITVLTHLTNAQKQQLLSSGIILCSELLKKQHMLQGIGVTGRKIDALMREVEYLCGT
jgi:hypothetical protein